ncbi:unnamed protein product [Meloidogyne enterolobii]|uniref:Uncharacterized protein n=1 Tax=Meloidogyne enterolobii TaxID=390850 RepID=A0ACB1AVI0_MELEN
MTKTSTTRIKIRKINGKTCVDLSNYSLLDIFTFSSLFNTLTFSMLILRYFKIYFSLLSFSFQL